MSKRDQSLLCSVIAMVLIACFTTVSTFAVEPFAQTETASTREGNSPWNGSFYMYAVLPEFSVSRQGNVAFTLSTNTVNPKESTYSVTLMTWTGTRIATMYAPTNGTTTLNFRDVSPGKYRFRLESNDVAANHKYTRIALNTP